MSLFRKKNIQFLIPIFTMMLGSSIYIFFRTDKLLMFKWFEAISIDVFLIRLRETTLPIKHVLPGWFVNSLPDGLWVFSYTTMMLLIWNNQICKRNYFWIFIIPLIALLSEVGQYFNLVQGTFDSVDIFFYFIGTSLPFLLFLKNNHITKLT